MTHLFIDEPPCSPACSLGPGSTGEDRDGVPHGASPVLGSRTRTPKFPPFHSKHVCFRGTPSSVLTPQDSPGPGHQHDKEPASGPASQLRAPLWGGSPGRWRDQCPIFLALVAPIAPSPSQCRSFLPPVWPPCFHGNTRSLPQRHPWLATSSAAFVFPAFVSCSALAAGQARHPFQSSLCFIGEIAGQKYM